MVAKNWDAVTKDSVDSKALYAIAMAGCDEVFAIEETL